MRIVLAFGSTMNPHLGGAAPGRWGARRGSRRALEEGFDVGFWSRACQCALVSQWRSRYVRAAQSERPRAMAGAMNLLVRTKSECPPPRGGEIERPRLTALLDDACDRRLLLIVAPGG